MALENFVVTDSGKALLAESQTGEKITFTRAAVGDGELDGQDPEQLTDIVHKVLDLSISSLSRDQNIATVKVLFSNADMQEAFFLREMALYAKDDDGNEILYAYGNAGATPDSIPQYSVAPTEFVFSINLVIADSATISAVINGSLVYATKDDLAKKADLENGVVSASELPKASTDIAGVIKLSQDLVLNEDGTLAINKSKVGGTGAVPITIEEDNVAAAIELPIKFNDNDEVIAMDDSSGTGIISLEQIGRKLEFIAREVL